MITATHPHSRPAVWLSGLLPACLVSVLIGVPVPTRAQEVLADQRVERTGRIDSPVHKPAARAAATVATEKPGRGTVRESDDLTFRPTVLVRRGSSQGSGTIVASLDRETLVVTAGHVIRGQGPIIVEFHRYNLGIENATALSGKWPRQMAAERAALDASADVAVLRIRDMVALPYVARLGSVNADPAPNVDLTSVGIDLGARLSSWDTRLMEILWLELHESGRERPFLVTDRIPEHGRSGGGIFDQQGRLMGICVGHAEVIKGRRMGIFSSVENVRDLLQANELSTILDRSEARRSRLVHDSGVPVRHFSRPHRSFLTPTEAQEPTMAVPPRP